jgi:hypothetical protein
MGIRTDTSWQVSGGARSLANAFRMTKKVGDISRPPSAESTPNLISVLGLRSLRARRRHDDRWGDLALNIDAAARSFRAVQLQEGNPPRWQREPYRSRPLPGSCALPHRFLRASLGARKCHPYDLLPKTSISDAAIIDGGWLAHGLLS